LEIAIAIIAQYGDDAAAKVHSRQQGGKAVHFSRRSVRASLIFVPLLALLGCQKANDTAPPTAAVKSANGAEAQSNAAVDSPESKPEPDHQHPIFAIDTSVGKITVRLDAEKAPLTVYNFRSYAASGHYDATIFHQVVKKPVQIVLGGVYTADLKAKPISAPIRNEADNGLKNTRGTIAMLRRSDDEDSATCQFFFNISDNNALNYKDRTPKGYGYCVFGDVTEGMDVLDRIAGAPVQNRGEHVDLPVETVAIKSIREVK
jgi:cyclophilin family peptidyl-prolyl cis-trans isomerase